MKILKGIAIDQEFPILPIKKRETCFCKKKLVLHRDNSNFKYKVPLTLSWLGKKGGGRRKILHATHHIKKTTMTHLSDYQAFDRKLSFNPLQNLSKTNFLWPSRILKKSIFYSWICIRTPPPFHQSCNEVMSNEKTRPCKNPSFFSKKKTFKSW